MADRPLPSLAGATFLRMPGLCRIFEIINNSGGDARVVGGAVRDALLGRKIGDVDVATTLVPDAVMAAARHAGIRAVPTGIAHGTVTLVTGGAGVEVTTLRRDVTTDGRRATVAFTTDWLQDAARRDFTMNALYAAANGQVFDPVGGIGDLLARRVRFIGQAETRIAEDYLRSLRFFRIHAQLGSGELDQTGLDAIQSMTGGLVNLSAERVRQELLATLGAPGAVTAVRHMESTGVLAGLGLTALDIRRFGALVAVENLLVQRGDGLLRLAALTLGHDCDAAALTERFVLSNKQADRLLRLWQAGAGPDAGSSQKSLTEFAYRHGIRALADRLKLSWAADGGTAASSDWKKTWAIAETLVVPVFPVSGKDLLALGASPGPDLGKALADLEIYWQNCGFSVDKTTLLDRYRSRLSAT